MRFSAVVSLACSALPLVVRAAPLLQTRQLAADDALVLKFALVLNQLEQNFYGQALAKFQDSDFTAAGFSVTDVPEVIFKNIQAEEQEHIDFLTAALNNDTVTGCQFDFTSVLTDVKTMTGFARVLEQVGVSAFLGAAQLVSSKSILVAAASVLTIEARHQSLLNTLNGGSHIPQPFDQAITPPQVLALASPFISGCDLGITPNLPVNITNAVTPGNKLEFDLTGIQGDQLFCQMILAGQPIASSQPIDNCIVPTTGLPSGPVFIFISNDTQPLSSNVVVQNAGQIVAGPTIAFLDLQSDALGALILNTGNATQADTSGSNSDLQVLAMSMQSA